MAERYTRVYSIPDNLYAEGSPVVINAGALLLDNKTNTVIAQLKLQNIGTKVIKAVVVGIVPLDIAGDPNGSEIEYQYLDTTATRDDQFGDQIPIHLPDNTTRGFYPHIKSVVYEDNQREIISDTKWEPLPKQDTLFSMLRDRYAVEQFQEQYDVDFEYIPVKYKDIWICGCKAINLDTERNCHRCKFEYEQIQSVNIKELQQRGSEAREADNRIKQKLQEEEKRLQQEIEEKKQLEAAEKEKRDRKIRKIVYCSMGIVIVLCVLSYFRIQSNEVRANRIANAFIGKTFIASGTEDITDDSYPYGNDDKVVGTCEYVYEQTFKKGFTVNTTFKVTDTYDSDFQIWRNDTYPQFRIENGTYTDTDSCDFGVEITFWGEVIFTEGVNECELKLDSNDLPVSYIDTAGCEYKLKE